MEERTEWRGQNESQIEGKEKWQTCWCCRDQQRTCRMAQASAEKLEHTGPAEEKGVASVPQREQLASTRQEAKRKKEQSRLSRVPDHEGGESQSGRELHLARGGSEREHGVERVDSTVKEGRFQGVKGGQARRASLEQVQGSMSG